MSGSGVRPISILGVALLGLAACDPATDEMGEPWQMTDAELPTGGDEGSTSGTTPPGTTTTSGTTTPDPSDDGPDPTAADESSGGGESSGDGDDSSGGMGEPIFEEIDGILAVEAEHADAIDDNGTPRTWYRFSAGEEPSVKPDPDPPHWDSASGGACLEGLPDTRVTHDDPLVGGESFYGQGGEGPILRYRVWINNPGRYWVRVRAYSTGTEDNGVHVGLDGSWPASGARVQWCEGKNQWTWSGAQRTDANHCGEANMIFLDIDSVGEHEIAFSMREDGFEMDKWMLTNNADVFPEGAGPDESPYVD